MTEDMNLDGFLSNESIRNAWVSERSIRIYIRRSMRYVGEQMVPCLDVGSVEVMEKDRGTKVFTSFLGRFEVAAKQLKRGVYVESILEKRLLDFLLRRGYTNLTPDSICPSVYKKITN
jgi:hypothetical protein